MHKTKNDLAEPVRAKAVAMLNEHLAQAIDLMLRAKQAHWNVKGANFIALHQLFDRLNEELSEYVDLIAERAVALGGIAEGLISLVQQRTKLGEYSLSIFEGRDHLEAISSGLATWGRLARHAIDQASQFGDLDTADVFTEVSRGLDKKLWFIEAHLQGRG
jgi:starvation-inducible DNA-binding protein